VSCASPQPSRLARAIAPQQRLADSGAASFPGDAHALDLGARQAMAREAVNDRKLQAADHRAARLDGQEDAVAGLAAHALEGVPIGLRERLLCAFALRPERVLGE